MTSLLTQAFDRAAELSEESQDALARQLLAELDADRRWDDAFASPRSEDLLTRLADRALATHRNGETEPLDDAAFDRVGRELATGSSADD
ncbi:hypothetical protein [Alienimonas chondri]|uniref:Uncharacterized protein n=1 Tax=Alienimonas chondri TaxID=2681879 RepID=A0ABX1VLZ9_9PLAN|nr:hypothetical protein [Alienimonas chondri]NNJ27977.1 hypothetical protein [Alienimonas chondri]